MSLSRFFYRLDHSWRVLILFGLGVFITPQIVAIVVAMVDIFLFGGYWLPNTPVEIDNVLFPWYAKITLVLVSVLVGLLLVRRYANR